jgi:hypothetical protein
MKTIEKYSDGEELGFKATDRTPFVWAMQSGEIIIRGRSIPDDFHSYLESILEWIDEYIKHPQPTTTLHIGLEYLNGITSQHLYEILRRLCNASKHVVVNWEYKEGEEDTLDQAQILAATCKAQFNYIKVNALNP